MTKAAKKSSRKSDPATKQDLDDLRKDFRSEMSATEYRILEQMTLLLEHHRHDIIGATKDDIVSLKTRVTRLEHHAGLAV